MTFPATNGESDIKYENEVKEEGPNPEYNLARDHNQLERGLKSRHIQFLALGLAHFNFFHGP